jgi:hypothetical protein
MEEEAVSIHHHGGTTQTRFWSGSDDVDGKTWV